MSKIGILGAGTWGIALARRLSLDGHDVIVWSAIDSEIEELAMKRVHPKLPDMRIPEAVIFTKDVKIACTGVDVILIAVPSVYVRSTAKLIRPYCEDGQIIVNVAKGMEAKSLLTLTDVIYDELKQGENPVDVRLVAMSGPTHAEEVAQDQPTTIVSACSDMHTAEVVQTIFSSDVMRVYTNTDVLGVELCGALKNVIALAVGISDGLGYGDNTKAAIMTRGMAEITRLGMKMGCAEQTFCGLAGMGDLIVTSTSKHSRNNRAGQLIGKGYAPEEAVRLVGMVVEGINALHAAMQLSKKYKVEIPIIETVNQIVNEGKNPAEAVGELMGRKRKAEFTKQQPCVEFEKTILRNDRGVGMKRVITYGTFDLLHYGHINLLKRAKALGDYLVVCLSTDEFNWNEKRKKCYFTYEQRKALLESIRYVDLVIPEETWNQKVTDVHEYHIDTFVIGDDWKGRFDFLKDEGVEVVYLPRTPEISTTQIKKDLNNK